ncbi:MAG: flavin reductase family protein [Solobacterium sp.]|nr:flavin reductase family protein [Solobacterium sp.]
MERKYIDYKEYSQTIIQALPKGILLTTKVEDKVNSMVIGWGTIGIIWGRPIFITYVREGRYTRELLDKSLEFTINTPLTEDVSNALRICGTQSGKKIDKIKECSFTLLDGERVSVPAIQEFPLTLECKVLYRQPQVLENIPEEIRVRAYPQDVDSSNPGANKDFHICYYGEIVNAYIVE